jgi:hypothetical protein
MTAPPPPPATGGRPRALYDTECFPNYWLLKIKALTTGIIYTFRLRDGETFDTATIAQIRTLFEIFCVISFNGNYYDVPMICAAMCGYRPDQLKWMNDEIILNKKKPWELGLPEWKPTDHIDVMEVAPGMGSQKQYAGRIHCKLMRDLPYTPDRRLTEAEIVEVESYCENDLTVLGALFDALNAQIKQREMLGKRYGIDLRSKSDAQLAEAVLKLRCEQATGRRIYKPDVDWNMRFVYNAPSYIQYQLPQLQRALELVRQSIFTLGTSGGVEMPSQLEGLEITINQSTYKMGIGGLHSQEKRTVHKSDNDNVLLDKDVAAYYPALILQSGEYPSALGPAFIQEYAAIKAERLAAKDLQGKLKKSGNIKGPEFEKARVENEGGKIMINGTFGKTGSPYSVLFAPTMLIQTTLTGQLSLLMLIEWHELSGIPIISANTDGIILKCPRHLVDHSNQLVAEWKKRTGLEMETVEYRAVYSRDINNYFAIKTDGEVKRKGEYSQAGLNEKKNPDVEICADAVAEFLSKGTPIIYTIAACRDIRKFVAVQKVAGGGVKMWGGGARKDARVMDMVGTLESHGWVKEGRKWRHGEIVTDARTAYGACFKPQTPEYLGKVVRWYYGSNAPGPIVYATNNKTVTLSYGAKPCMTLPDEFPNDIDYNWYIQRAEAMLQDIGFYVLT